MILAAQIAGGVIRPVLADELDWQDAREHLLRLGFHDAVEAADRYVAAKVAEAQRGVPNDALYAALTNPEYHRYPSRLRAALHDLLAR